MIRGLTYLALVAALGMGSLTSAFAAGQKPKAQDVPASGEQGKEVSIPFANHGVIHNWKAVDRDTLLIEVHPKKWYRAELFAPCHDLPFATTIGFKTEPSGSLNRFSSIIVRGQECHLKSLTRTDPPSSGKAGAETGKADPASAEPAK